MLSVKDESQLKVTKHQAQVGLHITRASFNLLKTYVSVQGLRKWKEYSILRASE